ncbi:MAG: primosomal protein N' [Gammaproteobacteria bacterium]
MANMHSEKPLIFRVAVPVPLYRLFDYLPPDAVDLNTVKPGIRLRVPFGKGKKTAYLTAIVRHSECRPAQLKQVEKILDPVPLLQETDMRLLHWASRYYHYPLGEVIAAAFPVLLRQGRPAALPQQHTVYLTAQGRQTSPETLRRAPKQRALLEFLQAQTGALSIERLQQWDAHWRSAYNALQAKAMLATAEQPPELDTHAPAPETALCANSGQQAAIAAVTAALGQFAVFLLDGVTGSGKTEVYMQIIQTVLEQRRQILVLLPEITLTPQLEARFRKRFPQPITVFHSGLPETERQIAWLQMQQGHGSILLGTRSALFTPLKNPGLIILDEEHDASFKQQEGFRFSARDVAVVRGRHLGIPVLLGSATPSLESLHNAARHRYRYLRLAERAGGAAEPSLHLLDIRNQTLHEGLSSSLLTAIEKTLYAGEQALLFVNRRGFAPTLICHGCGWVARCRRCDANLVLHRCDRLLRCHHCALEHALYESCPKCGTAPLTPLGLGTERAEAVLTEKFPAYPLLRLDRDTTRHKGSLETMLNEIEQGAVKIILGTQMLAKGHHFPNVTLVAIVDADSGLFSVDFRATEKLAQLIMQVAGRAGRAAKPGRVLLQTRQPQHPLLLTLVREGYAGFVQALLAERRHTGLPPFSHQALLRAASLDMHAPLQFLQRLRTLSDARQPQGVEILGPVSAPMLRRAGKYRYQLLLQSGSRQNLHAFLDWLLIQPEMLKEAKQVQWSLDVDPLDLY